MHSFPNGNFTSLIRFSNHGAPSCYPYLLLDLILQLLFEKIELANVPDVDRRAKKKGFGVDGEVRPVYSRVSLVRSLTGKNEEDRNF